MPVNLFRLQVRAWLIPLMAIASSLICAEAEPAPLSPQEQMKQAGIELDSKKGQVSLEATVCLRHGMLEYLVCLTGRSQTFEHESLFSTKCAPSLLHLSLLAIGLQPCEFENPEVWEKKWSQQPKSRVKFEVEFEQDGKVVKRGVSELLKSRDENGGKVPDTWIFTGSCFGVVDGKQVYAADFNGGVIGLGLDGSSVLQPGTVSENPYQGPGRGLEIDSEKVPPRGTKVKLIFSHYSDPKQGIVEK